MKKIAVHFHFPHCTQQQYDSVWDDLRASGNEHPKGLVFHVGADTGNGGLFVTDVWESEEAFRAFGSTLMPLLQKSGMDKIQPQIMPIYHVYEAKEEMA